VSLRHIFARKDFDVLLAEMAGENRLRRVLGPVALTSLGVGAIIGAGIFVLTGLAANEYAGPAVILSFTVAAVGCAFAALCYAEFAAMAPVAGSVYTYAYTTLGEIFAWIIGWDLILEYAMSCAVVASSWSGYFNKFLASIGVPELSARLATDPFTEIEGTVSCGIINLPSVMIMLLVTVVLVIGIRESARTNAALVILKVAVVLFVIALGARYVDSANWHSIPVYERALPAERVVPDVVKRYYQEYPVVDRSGQAVPPGEQQQLRLRRQIVASYRLESVQEEAEQLREAGKLSAEEAEARLAAASTGLRAELPKSATDQEIVAALMPQVNRAAEKQVTKSWGILGLLGLNRWLVPADDATRGPFNPYGLSGIMLGAAIVFFAYIGFDSISTHAEEARRPQRDVPIGILVSLILCTILYVAVAAVITGMVPYQRLDIRAPIAAAFEQKAAEEQSAVLGVATTLISAGGLAGMTSVILVTLLSQARIFLAMARDGLLPQMFGTVHPRFRTPHLATMLTGAVLCVVAAVTPIHKLAEMVNIGTLLAFVMVCAAVLILRVQRPDAKRPFVCPGVWIVAPLGILVNLVLMLFLPLDTWLRLVVWLAIGLAIYFLYSRRHSRVSQHLLREIQTPGREPIDAPPDCA
jgi:APA family basic amino acid/polyamine antiporter